MATRPTLSVRSLVRVLAVPAIGGLALAVAFPPYGWWPLAVPAVAVLSLATHRIGARAGAVAGFAFGLVFFLALLDWVNVVGLDAWLALAVVQALFFVPLGAGLAVTSRLPGWLLWAACLWVGEEALRARVPFGGLPWGRLAFSQPGTPFTPYAQLAGSPLVTFAVALTGASLAALVICGARRRPVPAAVALAVAAAVPVTGAVLPRPTGGPEVTVAVVQGNVPRLGLDFNARRRAVLGNHVAATHRLAADVRAGRVPRPELVIWPENSSDIDPFADRYAYEIISGAVRDVGVPVLVGAVVNGPDADHVQNMGIVWDPDRGPGAAYVKRHPVPFGEYIPFRDVLTRYIKRLEQIPRDFHAGTRIGLLQVGPARVGEVICFEVAYDGLVRDAITAGGRVLVVQTNNATYGKTGQPDQQLAISRMRAVEHGRAVLIAATSGISAIVAPDGRLVDRSAEFTPDVMVHRVPLRDGITPASRLGALPEWILAIVGVLACVAAVPRRAGPPARPAALGHSATAAPEPEPLHPSITRQ
nr:apolipoprotein N-acyltransferase [Carbonactinospora thermoautotrophica]